MNYFFTLFQLSINKLIEFQKQKAATLSDGYLLR